ncbi:hypothetical protein Dimus_006701, partial [Dionaea muscipula]
DSSLVVYKARCTGHWELLVGSAIGPWKEWKPTADGPQFKPMAHNTWWTAE